MQDQHDYDVVIVGAGNYPILPVMLQIYAKSV